MYVGSGYRQMSESFNRILDEPITIIEEKFDQYKNSPMIVPEYGFDNSMKIIH